MKKTITEQLRELGFTNKEIKRMHNIYFKVDHFRNYEFVTIEGKFLRFINFTDGQIFEFSFC